MLRCNILYSLVTINLPILLQRGPLFSIFNIICAGENMLCKKKGVTKGPFLFML